MAGAKCKPVSGKLPEAQGDGVHGAALAKFLAKKKAEAKGRKV